MVVSFLGVFAVSVFTGLFLGAWCFAADCFEWGYSSVKLLTASASEAQEGELVGADVVSSALANLEPSLSVTIRVEVAGSKDSEVAFRGRLLL